MQRYVAAVQKGLRNIAEKRAPEITSWMQANKVWSDRTYEAVSTLHTDIEVVSNELIELMMSHGAAHGWYLEGYTPFGEETQRGGRYAILGPAVDYWFPIIMQDIQKMLSDH